MQKRALTEKQQSVCGLIEIGLSNKQIGERLGISPRTVEAHRVEIFRKMGVRNAVELVRVLLSTKRAEVHG